MNITYTQNGDYLMREVSDRLCKENGLSVRQRNAHRASPAALRTSENRHHHALCNGETTECEAGT